ncbi:ABC transporter permease [Sodalinema gerasimenkoae]|uniref:ABC transporter permease n=1 Tax=Sodalinema gerasimenkoae TaxID=2862348 RepID=UPI00135A9C4C|nr:ABC transporter permease [Sodalinema gerasimenkoae]
MTSPQSTSSKSKPRLVQSLLRVFQNDTLIYVIQRLGQGLLTLFFASILCFAVMQLAPGDFLDTYSQNPTVSQEMLDDLRRQYGLDQPPVTQYRLWLTSILTQGDFGWSLMFQQNVSTLISSRVANTLLLSILSLIITWSIAIPLGILAAVRQNSTLDRILRVVSYGGQGFPSFITALLLLILAQNLTPLVPVGNMTSVFHQDLSPLGKVLDVLWHALLPTLALSITSFAGLQRLMRGQLLDVLRQDYIRTARAKGLPENKVIYVHALRNAINPLITLLGFEFAALLSGSFIAEFFFSWPGLGKLILDALRAQDPYVVMAGLMMGATMLIVGNLLADLLLKAVDPRIQLTNSK